MLSNQKFFVSIDFKEQILEFGYDDIKCFSKNEKQVRVKRSKEGKKEIEKKFHPLSFEMCESFDIIVEIWFAHYKFY